MCTLAEELTKRGTVRVVTLEDDALAEHARSCGIDTVALMPEGQYTYNKIESILRAAAAIKRAVKDIDADIIHAHSAPAVRYVWPAASLCRIPVVAHQRDIYENNNFHRGLGLANHVIAISDWVKQTLSSKLAAKSTVVHNAVKLPNPTSFASPNQRTVGPGNPLRIGFAGRLKEEKGVDLLVDIATDLLQVAPHTEIHLWGVPNETHSDAYVRSIKNNILRLVEKFPGRIHVQPFRRDVEVFYRSMDVVVIPSRCAEPFGRVSIEAMAFGAVAVVANHGGLAEVVEHGRTGIAFHPDDKHDLLTRLSELITDDSERIKIATAGLDHVRSHFSAQAHADAILGVYRRVLETSVSET